LDRKMWFIKKNSERMLAGLRCKTLDRLSGGRKRDPKTESTEASALEKGVEEKVFKRKLGKRVGGSG